MKKYRPPLTAQDKLELERLSNIDFSTYNEADVREEFIVPLLRILGYLKESDYSISREEQYKLNPLFIQVGRYRIDLDYICSIRKQYFWIIESKQGKCLDKNNPPPIESEEIAQAHFYSLHPDVNCKYFIVTNGWFINLYERDKLDESLAPILTIKHKELSTRFIEIDNIIGSTQLVPHLKEDILFQIERILSSEVRLERLEEFLNEVNKVCGKVRPIVLQNFRDNAHQQEVSLDQEFISLLENTDLFEVPYTIFLSTNNFNKMVKASDIIIKRLISDQILGKQYLFFSKLLLEELFPVNYWYYTNVLVLLLKLNESDIKKTGYKNKTVKELLDEWVELVIFHFGKRRELRFLWGFEGLLYRFSKRILILSSQNRDIIKQVTDFNLFTMPEEETAWLGPSEGKTLITFVERMVFQGLDVVIRKYYNKRKREFLFELAYQEYERNEKLINLFSQTTETKYETILQDLNKLTNDWSELYGYDIINHYWDPLGTCVCDILLRFPNYTKTLDEPIKLRIKTLAELGHTLNSDHLCDLLNIEFKAPPKGVELIKNKSIEFYDPKNNPYEFKL